ncbi:hypothetical protein GN956_G5624 [Arapaima gigas]
METLCVLTCLLITAGLSKGVNIIQRIPVLFAQPGVRTETLHCEHDDNTYYTMLWYRQTAGAMDLLAYSGSENSATIEPPFKDSKYTMNRPETLKSSLEIKNLQPNDSAVYFCAASITH